MACGGEHTVRGDKYIVAECYRRPVKYGHIMVCVKIFAYGNIAAVVAVKRSRNNRSAFYGAENPADYLALLFRVRRSAHIELIAQVIALPAPC